MEDYTIALHFYEKALGIRLKSVSSTDPLTTSIYSNIGLLQNSLGNHLGALSYLKHVLETREKTLPSSDLSLATTNRNIGIT